MSDGVSENVDAQEINIAEAVAQLMELNGAGDGWELRTTLEHAKDTENILRALLNGTICNGQS